MSKIVINEDGTLDVRVPTSVQQPTEESVCGRAEIAAAVPAAVPQEPPVLTEGQ